MSVDYKAAATAVVWGHTTATPERCNVLIAEVAAALRRAHAAGLREAEAIVNKVREDDNAPHDLRDARDAITSRAEEVERS